MSLPPTETVTQIQGLSAESQDSEKVIGIESVVTVQFPAFNDDKEGEIARLMLVDTPVVDPKAVGLLYVDTPIGRAILGKKEGDTVRVELKENIMSYDLEILVVRDAATLLKQEP